MYVYIYIYYSEYHTPLKKKRRTKEKTKKMNRSCLQRNGSEIINSEVAKQGWINGVPAKCPQVRHKMF